jgi:hypothetical protein
MYEKESFKDGLMNSVIRKQLVVFNNNNGQFGYNEGKIVVSSVNDFFLKNLGIVPKQIKVACDLSLVFLAPSAKEKEKLLKDILLIAGGIGGIAAILGGIGMAAGWGAGVIAKIIAWFAGTSMSGPLGWIIGGITLATIVGYFYFKKEDGATEAEKFEKILIGGLDKAIDEIWAEHGIKLSGVNFQ